MKHRVLIVNKFYYPRGGDCVCTLNLETLLKEKGHEVAVYAMQYPENIESPFSRYFASEVSFSGGVSAKIAAAKRIFGWGNIVASFKKVLADFKPDVIHFNNIHSYLSPVIVKLAHEAGAKTVWTMHDYKLLCPSYTCRRGEESCELCFTDKSNVFKYKCMKGSTAASLIALFEAKKWDCKTLSKITDCFVCPSQFMERKMNQGGFTKTAYICNFVDPVKMKALKELPILPREDYYIYVGRLSEEKGMYTLLDAAKNLPYKLKVAGGGPLADELKEKYKGCTNIEFLGHCNATQVSNLFAHARFSVTPSEWYENNPLSIIESLCAGTPVVGANIGGIPELLDNGCGVTFTSKESKSLVDAINKMWNTDINNAAIKEYALNRFSQEEHYRQLMEVYNR